MENKKNKYLLVIGGPTAVGKTALSVRLAKHFKTEILSADSRQFYKEMNIGTAKPSAKEMQGVPHHFVDFISVKTPYDVGKYEKEALNCLEKIYRKHSTALLTGGSGLFIRAVCEGLDQFPEVSEEIRRQLISKYEKEGIEALQTLLQKQDPQYYREVDKQNPRRLIRALEVVAASGKPFSFFRKQTKKKRPFHSIKIMLNRTREALYTRINRRVEQMLEAGLEQEVRALWLFRDLSALKTVGYQEFFDCWAGKHDRPEAIRLLKQNSRRYAKRQLSWFRRDSEFRWFHPDEAEKIIAHIEKQMESQDRR